MPEATASGAATRRDSVGHTLAVAVGLSLVCSLLVATTAIMLKPVQQANEERFRQQVIEQVAGLQDGAIGADSSRYQIVARMVALESGAYVDQPDPKDFDPVQAAADPASSVMVPKELDVAGIRRRSRYAPVYLVVSGDQVQQIILPVYGAGLWSTLRGYLALQANASTIEGLRFYDHAETPGLGDQIDSEDWLGQWQGKKLFGADGMPQVRVARGAAPRTGAGAQYQVDGLSGATLTGLGVTRLIHYWTGPHGFGPYLKQQAESGGQYHE